LPLDNVNLSTKYVTCHHIPYLTF